MIKTTTVSVDGQDYVIKLPNERVIREADAKRSIEFSKCIEIGVKTQAQTKEFLKKHGVWTEEKEEKEKDIVKSINRLELEISRGDGLSQKTSINDGLKKALKIKELRENYLNLIRERQSYESNTAESIADNARFDYFVCSSVFNKDNTKVYATYEQYQEDSSSDLAFKAASALAKMMYSLEEDFMSKLAENKFLKKFGLVDDKMRLVDRKTKHLVDNEGRKINELGHYLNDKDERIDREGNLLDIDGNYIIETVYIDEDGNEIFPIEDAVTEVKSKEENLSE